MSTVTDQKSGTQPENVMKTERIAYNTLWMRLGKDKLSVGSHTVLLTLSKYVEYMEVLTVLSSRSQKQIPD